jgi:ribose 5-phosphate isomerase B
MRVHLGSDHAGFELKQHLAERIAAAGHEVVDHGPLTYDPEDDYPPYCLRAAAAAAGEPGSLGVVIGGSGNGEQIAANKVPGIRCALAWSDETATLARQHNDAQVVSVGGRMHPIEDMTRFVEVFLTTAFTGEERHVRRLAQIADYERTRELPPLPASAQQPAQQPVQGSDA